MYEISKHPGPFDEALIDERNERPLTSALTAIVMVWSLAFAIAFASGHGRALLADSPSSGAAVVSSADK